MGNRIGSVGNMILDPLSLCSGYEVSSLVRINTVWNILMVDKAFCKSMNGSFGRSIKFREGNYIYRGVSTPVRTKQCPFHEGSGLMQLPCHQVFLLLTLGNGALSKAQCWSLLLADLTFRSNCSLVSLGELEVHVIKSMHKHYFNHQDHFAHGLLGRDRDDWRKKLIVHRMGHPT